MQVFLISLFAVAVLLLTAVPGYLLIKRKLIGEDCIAGFSKVLIYVTQPCLVIYSFKTATFSPEKLLDIGVFALLCIVVNGVMLLGSYLVLRKRCEDPIYRIMTIATTFGNCAFFGVPIIEALFPEEASGLIVFTTVYAVVMNILGWTVGSAIISRNTKYVSVKKIFVNPATIGAYIGLFLFVLEIPLVFTIPGTTTPFKILSDMVTATARMATPLSMLVMGMRLATMDLKATFTNPKVYLTIAVKQFVMPLVALLVVLFLPIDPVIKRTFFIICACPVASIVLNYAEIVGAGQKEGANMVLLGTMLSIVTLPIMSLLLGVF